MKNFKSAEEALSDLKERGYEANFETQSFCLYCGDLDLRLNEQEFHVDEVYHVKEDPGQIEESTIYAFTSSTGVKGTIIDENLPGNNNIVNPK
jgi:hypothetical protein